MWKFEHTETTAATAEQLWKRYADAPTWPEWDHETQWVTVDGPFAVGTTGTLKPVGGPKTRFRFVEVTEGRSFADVSDLPLAKMHFVHLIEPTPQGTRFTHSVTISGLLAPLFARVIGRKIAAGLPEAMRRLSALASAAA